MATIRKRGRKWQAIVRHKTIGTIAKSFFYKSEAIKWSFEQEKALENGTFGCLCPKEMTLRRLLERYLLEVTPLKKGKTTEARRLNRLINDDVGKYQINNLTSQVIAEFRDRRSKDGVRTCHYDLTLIRHCISIAVSEWGLMISENPVSKVKMPTLPLPRERRLKDGELKELETAAELTQNPNLWPVVIFAIETAMRRGEILSLRWNNINFQTRIAHLPVTKNGLPRDVPLTSKAIVILENQLGKNLASPFPITSNALRMAWDRLRRRAGVKDFRFHDLRHEAISRFFEMGLSISEVAMISGHKDPKMLFRYTHIKPASVLRKLQ